MYNIQHTEPAFHSSISSHSTSSGSYLTRSLTKAKYVSGKGGGSPAAGRRDAWLIARARRSITGGGSGAGADAIAGAVAAGARRPGVEVS